MMDAFDPEILLEATARLASLQNSEEAAVCDVFSSLARLFQAGGPLSDLELDPQALISALERNPPEFGTEDDIALQLMAEAVTQWDVERFITATTAAANDHRLPREDRIDCAIAALSTLIASDDDGFDLTALPAVEIWFGVRIAELFTQMSGMNAELEQFAAEIGENDKPSDILKRVASNAGQFGDLVGGAPAMRAYLEREALGLLDAAERLVADDRCPPFLSVPELVRISAAMSQEKRSGADAKTVRTRLEAIVTDEAFFLPILDRLSARSRDPELPDQVRDDLSTLLLSIPLDPLSLIAKALMNPRLLELETADAKEDELLTALLTSELRSREAIVALEQHLESRGDQHGARLLGLARTDFEASGWM